MTERKGWMLKWGIAPKVTGSTTERIILGAVVVPRRPEGNWQYH
jgi:hypothetical protein